MDVQMLTQYFLRYGAVFIFVIILLEYMNLPGFPAGIIMPLAGIWAARGQISFFMVMALGLAAGLLGSWILYGIGRMGGDLFLDRYLKRFPKHEPAIQRNFELLRTRGAAGIFISKLIPMIRTIISIPAGVIRMNFVKYTISSALGIFVWNFFLIGAGYVMGDHVFQLLS
ncbi:DedA family protein [Enterocloster bolteae]|uniref:DedA family protein n=1 Tax=Enterocloster bolteae TaxID=208479 RepID=UPI001D086B6A|nr:DedA family protein [Enterocloster bolteae]MCB6924124.1 DedA family protein [Enterocloster bolteae]MCQ4758092.1 DedA family protein [Enterocloster bolteae]